MAAGKETHKENSQCRGPEAGTCSGSKFAFKAGSTFQGRNRLGGSQVLVPVESRWWPQGGGLMHNILK